MGLVSGCLGTVRTDCPKPWTVPKNVMIKNGLSRSVGKGLLLVISSNKMVNAIQILSTINTVETAGQDAV